MHVKKYQSASGMRSHDAGRSGLTGKSHAPLGELSFVPLPVFAVLVSNHVETSLILTLQGRSVGLDTARNDTRR